MPDVTFKEIDFMSKMRLFLENPPFLDEGETISIDYMQIDPASQMGEGNAVAIAGMPRPTISDDILGNVVLQQEINWIFTMRRFTNDNKLRKDIGNFIGNYNLWVNTSQALRQAGYDVPNIPTFGDTENEVILASGGMGMGGTEEPNLDEFQIQISITFEKNIESEN